MFRELTLSAIASWPTPNYENPQTRGNELYITTGIFLAIATISLLARLYSRIFIRRYFGPDDYLIVFAYISTLGVTACVSLGNEKYGWDRHVWDIFPTKLAASMKVLYWSRICWGLATSSVRLSICCLYYRLLERIRAPKSYFWVLHIFTAFTAALALVYVFTGIFPCLPVKAYWTLSPIPGQGCDDDPLVMKVVACINTVSEFLIACMPIIAVFKLHIDPKQRWTVIGLLSLSFFVAFAGCFRTYYLWRAMSAPALDMTWWAVPHFIASEVEIDISITCACAAPLRPLISYIYRRIKGLPSHISNKPGRPSTSTYRSKAASEYESASYAGYSTPLAHYFDLEGIACDGYGYTVTISGPLKKSRRLRRRKNVRESDTEDMVLEHPPLSYTSPSYRSSDAPSREPKGVAFDIGVAKEVVIRESWHGAPREPRTSDDLNRFDERRTRLPTFIDNVERAGNKQGKSWFQD